MYYWTLLCMMKMKMWDMKLCWCIRLIQNPCFSHLWMQGKFLDVIFFNVSVTCILYCFELDNCSSHPSNKAIPSAMKRGSFKKVDSMLLSKCIWILGLMRVVAFGESGFIRQAFHLIYVCKISLFFFETGMVKTWKILHVNR